MGACSSSFSSGERRVGDLLLWLLGRWGYKEVGVWRKGMTGRSGFDFWG